MAAKKEVPQVGTEAFFTYAAAQERSAVADGKATNEARQAAARIVYRGFAQWASNAPDDATIADKALVHYYPNDKEGKSTMPKGDTLASRKREWNNIAQAARLNAEKTLAIWPEPVTGKRNITRKMFLEGCTMVHKSPALSSEKILELLRAKKDPVVANAGDLMGEMFGNDGIMMSLIGKYPAEWAPFIPAMNDMRARWAEGRAKGLYQTTEEAAKAAADKVVPIELKTAA